MRIFALALQIIAMALCPPALIIGLFAEKGMGIELTMLFIAIALFYAGRALEPKAKA